MRVLIVDDSKAMRMIVKRTLRSAGFTGLDVSEAGDGAEALSAIQKSPPDVVLTDWNMPNLNGIELVRKLKEQNSPVTIGVVTSESSAEMCDEAVAAGAAFFITKPFTAETFGQALDGLLGQAGAGSSDGATTQAQSAVPDVSGLRTALARLVPRNVDVAPVVNRR